MGASTASGEPLEPPGPSSDDIRAAILAYHLRLVDLATRAMTAELGISADATATHRQLEQTLRRHLGDEGEALRLSDRMVAHIGFAAPLGPEASAAVFAGPTWHEMGRTPPGPTELPRPVDHEEQQEGAFTDLRAALRAADSWDDQALLAGIRLRSMRRLAGDTRVRLTRREETKAALLALGGEVRRVHLHLGRRLVEAGVLGDASEVDLLSPMELRGLVGGDASVTPDVISHRRRWQARYEQEGPLPHGVGGVLRALVGAGQAAVT